MTDLLSRDELVRYFRTEEYADEIADIISNFPPADHLPNLPQTIAEGFANSLFNQGKIEVNWAGMSDEEKLAYLTAARDLPDLPQEAPDTRDEAIKTLNVFFSILRGHSTAIDHYRLEVSRDLYDRLRALRDRMVRERAPSLTRPNQGGEPQTLTVTPEMVEAVRKTKCFACGAFPYEDCQRHPQRDCGRGFNGGSRKAKRA